MFLNVCKQTFHTSHVRISQKVKGIWNVKSSTYYFYMKTKILADFQICISIPLINFKAIVLKKTSVGVHLITDNASFRFKISFHAQVYLNIHVRNTQILKYSILFKSLSHLKTFSATRKIFKDSSNPNLCVLIRELNFVG